MASRWTAAQFLIRGLVALALATANACVYVATEDPGPPSYAMPPDPTSRLGTLLEADTSTGHALVVDDPHLALTARLDLIESAEQTVDVQYFIWQNDPSGILVIDRLLRAADRGVRISVVTNSLASNDVVIAHAAYARYRQLILDTGVELYEFRGDPAMMEDDPAENFSLHPKFMIFDDDTVFLGSLNLDPRSLYLNTELGVVLRSESLAAELRRSFGKLTSPDNAWQVTTTPQGLQWESSAGVMTEQPAKSAWQRFRSSLMMMLPVSKQL